MKATFSNVQRNPTPFSNDVMNYSSQSLQINIHKVDGSVATFTQSEANLVNRILKELHPARMFNQEKIAIACKHSVARFPSALITRVDLITDQLSVWDFPFLIGALQELTETEFQEFLFEQQRRRLSRPSGDFPLFLDVEMVDGQRLFLWMEVIAGFPAEQLSRDCSRLKERSLIFGLRTGGIGVLNPANLARFTVHSDLPMGPAELWPAHGVNGSDFERLAGELRGSADDGQPLSSFPQHSRTNFTPSRMELQ